LGSRRNHHTGAHLAASNHQVGKETMKKYIPLILIAVVFGAWMANILFIHP
jgi:hypothetical protein